MTSSIIQFIQKLYLKFDFKSFDSMHFDLQINVKFKGFTNFDLKFDFKSFNFIHFYLKINVQFKGWILCQKWENDV